MGGGGGAGGGGEGRGGGGGRGGPNSRQTTKETDRYTSCLEIYS